MFQSAYWAHPDFQDDLARELGDLVTERRERLFLSNKPAIQSVWAQNIWLSPRVETIASIGDAAKKLRTLKRDWILAPTEHVRRATLIQEQATPVKKRKPVSFPARELFPAPGSFTLLAPDTLVASADVSSRAPNGEWNFLEDKTTPPSRAYLKLWEFFASEQLWPSAGARAIDLGSSPGGWTWVLATLGCNVVSVDKADLAPIIAKLPNVEQVRADAFQLKPSDIGKVDWLFSDVICDPKRLLQLVQKWMESGLAKNFVCTIKFKGETDFETLRAFQAIEGSHVRHLFHNKHEVTWWLVRNS